MAALRYAARKICGRALQRPQVLYPAVTSPASSSAERGLLPMLINGGMPHISYTRHFTSSATPQPPVNNNNKSISGHRSPCPNPAADAKFHTNIDPASLETLVQEKKDELFRLLLQMDLHNDSCEKSAEENKAILRLLQQFRPETQDNTTLSRAATKNSANRYVLPVSIILSGIIIVAQCHIIARI